MFKLTATFPKVLFSFSNYKLKLAHSALLMLC